MDTTEELYGYFYAGMPNLQPGELFFWIMVDETMKQLGVKDVGAVVAILSGQSIISTRQKFQGARDGTSIASILARKAFPYSLPKRVFPSLVGGPIKGVKIILVNNLGAFVGRAVPVVGWIILAYDISMITYHTIIHYNLIVKEKDKLWG